MRLTATDIVSLYRPTPCSLRVYLREQSIPEAEPSAFDQILRTLGQRHELEHLASLGDYENLSVVPPDERIEQTAAAIRNRVPVIYQGEFSCETALTGIPVTIVGRPDFLILDGDGYVIRDSKLSRQVDEKHHEEITLQLQLYGWLFEQTVGVPAKRLEVHTGKGNIVDMPYDGGVAALAELVRILALKRLGAEPYEPVGWAKCAAGCGYYDHCWQQAEARQDVSLVMEVDQGLARKLHEDGIESAQQLVAGLDAQRLADLKRPWGDRQQKVGKKAEKILVYAGVLTSGKERMLGPVAIPAHDNYVMFDLEGMPPHLDDLEKIYLWGMRVYGKLPSAFMGVTAGFGTNGDQEGWAAFLDAAKKLFAVYGDIPFVHWHHYEKTHINQYIDRYGDPDGTAARVLRNLLDLLPIIKNAVALPLPSYSLKVVEEYIGFKRTQDEYGGSWAMAQFILATETDDEAQRSARMSEILKYNKEDLAATWAVFEWLRGAGGTVQTLTKILHLLENQQRQFKLLLGTVSQRRISRIPSDERGWSRVDRGIDEIRRRLEQAETEEQFQTVGLLCREVLISLAQVVYDPQRHRTEDGIKPSETDAKRMLESFIFAQTAGASNEGIRRCAWATWALANDLQHNRTADYVMAALCAEATASAVNLIAVLCGRRKRN
jgi:predicted RecB family nuclease